MRTLHLDFETFSELDLPKVGHYRYAEDESTLVLLCAYQYSDWPRPKLWAPAEGFPMPKDLEEAFADPETLLIAFNAAFERAICRECLGLNIPISRWRCAMVDAMAVGYPGRLELTAPAIGLPESLWKQEGGKKLINKFCRPRKPTRTNPAKRWYPAAAPEDWERFCAYCIQDVVAEKAIWDKKSKWPLPPIEQRLWELDQKINDRGIRVDLELVRAAHAMGTQHRELLVEEAMAITGLQNPNSVKQLVEWLNRQPDFDPDEENEEVNDLRKKTVEQILGREDIDGVVRQVLELRQQIAKSSLKKYETLLRATCLDGYIRGTMQFYGANRTGRWAGRLLQVQNLPQGIIEDRDLLAYARELVRQGAYDTLVFLFGRDQVPNVLSSLIRSCLVASEGHRLVVADLSAIEARVTAWFARCAWRLDVFRTHGMIYEASASQMFSIPFSEFKDYKKRTGKHHPARKKGKVSELALGYQGAVNALVTMGALEMGLSFEELQPMVLAWRQTNPEIAGVENEETGYWEGGLWRDVEKAAKTCLRTHARQEAAGCLFRYAGGGLVITLPSGRNLHYTGAHLAKKDSWTQIAYWGVDQKTKRWGLQYTYGGKLVENIVQAFSRDILREILFRLPGYHPIMLVHDEGVFDEPIGHGSLEEVLEAMSTEVEYAPGLPLKGDGFESPFYMK